MIGEMKPSLFERFFGAALFFTFSLVSIVWFTLSAYATVSGVVDSGPILSFNKGAMYMLGVSIGGFSLSIGVAYHSIFLRKVPEKVEKTLMRGAVIGILIMIILPQVTHIGINRIVHDRQYIECRQARFSWLLYQKYYYTKNQNICQDLVAEMAKSSGGR